MFSAFFIDRPKFALVISLVLTVMGVLGYVALPVEQFPEITPPVVQVSTTFTGASGETLEETVASPIEAEVNGVDNMLYMKSNSMDSGRYSLDVTFAVGTDPDMATVNTQNRVSQAMPKLPTDVTRNGVKTEKSSTSLLMMMALYAPDGEFDEVFLSNYASINIKDPLARIQGVGKADVITNFEYGMRIWLDPDKLAGLGMTPAEFISAIEDQNAIVPAGQVGAPPDTGDQQIQYTVKARGRLADPEEFKNIVLRSGDDSSLLTVGDVARVELGASTYSYSGMYNGVPATIIGIYQAPGANALSVADNIRAEMDRLEQFYPEGIEHDVVFDTTTFVQSSLNDVIETLFITFTLVVLVVFVFLGSLRATLIPMVAIPVSLIGTFAALLMLGMSLNTVTLFALVLAIGIVVDDAIIVVENVEKLIADGLSPRDATRKAMTQITAPVIATTLVLLAVFVPVTFMPGITGRLYSQFAVTISAAVVISSINALTLSPALCALILKPRKGPPRGLLAVFEKGVSATRNGYVAVVARLARASVMGLIAIGLVVAVIGTLNKSIPTGFLPSEDQGYLMADVQLPDGAALNRTEIVTARMEEIVEQVPGVRSVATVNGYSMLLGGSASNVAMLAISLEHWDDRQEVELQVNSILGNLWKQFDGIGSASIIVFNPPPIPGLGNSSGVELMVQQVSGGTPQELSSALGSFVYAANQRPEVGRAYTTFRANVPQLFVDLDREKAKALNVNVADVFGTLQAYLGSYYVNDFNLFSRTYKVMIQAEGRYRQTQDDIDALYVRSQTGAMVPLSTLVEVKPVLGPMGLNRFNIYRAAPVTADPAPGYSSGDVIRAMQEVAAEALPGGYAYQWTGTAVQELEAGGIVAFILMLAVLFAYLFLVAQYESWTMPVAILLTVTVAIMGAYVAVWLVGGDVNLYTQIGMIMLVGLGAKNAILIVEFAMELRASGKSIYDSAVDAARLRFRAVMMTALSFLLGVVPLIVAAGAGAASQRAIGIAVFGGMAAASSLGVILTPVLYAAIQSAREYAKGQYTGIHTEGAPEVAAGVEAAPPAAG